MTCLTYTKLQMETQHRREQSLILKKYTDFMRLEKIILFE